MNRGPDKSTLSFKLADSLLVFYIHELCKKVNSKKGLTKRVGCTPISHEYLHSFKKTIKDPKSETKGEEEDFRTPRPGCLIIVSNSQTRRGSLARSKTWKTLLELWAWNSREEMEWNLELKKDRLYVNNPLMDIIDDVTIDVVKFVLSG